MRREVAAAVVLVILLAVPWTATASPGPSPGQFLPRAPIVIRSDADFTAANGVVGGAGTPSDPYVIAGWHVKASVGSAIFVQNTTAHFVLRDNLVEGPTGISLVAVSHGATLVNNKLIVTSLGMRVANSNATIAENSFIGANTFRNVGTALQLDATNARVHGNSFSYVAVAILAERGTYVVTDNNIHPVERGVWVRLSVAGSVDNNTLTLVGHIGIEITESQHVRVSGNIMATVKVGIVLWLPKDADVVNNSIRFAGNYGVLIEHASGNFSGNVVVDSMGDGVRIWASSLVMANNTIANNLGIGLHFSMSESDVRGNLVVSNGIGIALYQASAPHLSGNVLINNTVGFDIPYDSRKAIAWMEGNFVNGVNVDGSVHASQKVFFHKAANVSIQGQLRDSGFSAGYYGSISAQGNVVLYEVDTANINGSIIGHANVGVGAVNSFNVNVQDTLIVNARIGVKAESIASPFQVPPCVVTVKDSNITIVVDPPLTIGVDVRACTAFVLRTNVSVVDIGVRFGAGARGSIENVTVEGTRIGLDVGGARGEIELKGNVLARNRVGARLAGFAGVVAESRFVNNTEAGAQLDGGSSVTLLRNNISGNAVGLVDLRACVGARAACSTVTAEGNQFWRNGGDGARVNGRTSWRGDVFLENRDHGLRLASDATLRGVVASRNGLDGLHVTGGSFAIRDSTFERNDGNGAMLRAGVGELRDSRFNHNGGAGLHLATRYVQALQINASHNFDGILLEDLAGGGKAPSLGNGIALPDVWRLLPEGSAYGASPLDVHLSTFLANRRDAVRAGTSFVNATYNYWGSATGPAISVGDEVGAYRNGVSPYVRFAPYFTDASMTTTGPIFLL